MELSAAIILFVIFTAVIGIAGIRLSRTADQFADLTGFGEAVVGGVLIGSINSLAGTITSITAAYQNHPELAVSNALGGILAQTTFLALADISYKKANLEHAAASYTNLMHGTLLIIMLSFIFLVTFSPEFSVMGTNPASILMILGYAAGVRMIWKAKRRAMWIPKSTASTVEDLVLYVEDENLNKKSVAIKFFILAAIVAFSGYVVAETGIVIAAETKLSETIVGGLFTGVATALPELIVTLTAVRQGALTLAVSNIVGGNTFDALCVAFSDIAYLNGSIYHVLARSQMFIIAMTLMQVSILVMGLLDREKHGIAGIGWESFLIIVLFVGGYALIIYS
ncbi:cation transporter [Methanosarcina sp. 1.H.T.1A.1]|uniref:sodium:calcium antiporter n=1 Tax=Methanosarcina sp. 1.H.T.1A.1 TaxID=1483602 RepID=UPI000621232C|nr:cation transporter [Methanosarcina sp. 1.H.T.1A.1]KKH98408.1 cation transporter [Methanosarcina sp. 1.H.T.1A.1]